MEKKAKKFLACLNQNITVSKRELLLGLSVCALAGVVTGILLSPRKSVTIGSNNGSNNSGNSAHLPQQSEEAACPPEEKEE